MWWWAPTNAHHCAIQPTITLTTFLYCILQCTNNATSSYSKAIDHKIKFSIITQKFPGQEDHLNSRRFPGFPGGFSNSRFPGFPGVVDTLYNYDLVQSILIIFSKLFANDHKSCLAVKFSTSPHICCHYTLWNTMLYFALITLLIAKNAPTSDHHNFNKC